MAITNLYPNLPGHLVEFKDGGLQFVSDSDDVAGANNKSLLILGTAYDGPVNNPVKISSSTVDIVFGSELDEYGRLSKATLTKAARQAFRNGFKDVRCMRVTGSPAEVVIHKKTPADPDVIATEKTGTYNITSNTADEIDLFTGGATVYPVLELTSIVNDHNGSPYSVIQIDISDKWNGKVKPNAANMFPIGTTASFTFKYMDTGHSLPTLPSGASSSDYSLTNGVIKCIKHTSAGSNGSSLETIPTVASNDNVTYPISDFTLGDADYINGDFFGSEFNTQTVAADNSDINGYNRVAIRTRKNVYVLSEGGAVLSDGMEFEAVDSSGSGTRTPLVRNQDYTITFNSAGDIIFTPKDDTYAGQDLELTVYRYAAKDGGSASNVALAPSSITYDLSNMFAEDIADIVAGSKSVVSVTAGSVTVAASNYTYDLTDGSESITINGGLTEVSTSSTVAVTVSYTKNMFDEYTVKFRTTYGGKVYNDAKLEIEAYTATGNDGDGPAGYEGKKFRFVKPEGKYTSEVDHVIEYNSWDFPTIELLALGMKNDVLNNDMFTIVYDDGSFETAKFDPETGVTPYSFSGGDDGVDGISEQKLFDALSGVRYTNADIGTVDDAGHTITTEDVGLLKESGAYHLLENYSVDYIYPAGAYADSKLDFFKELALVCAVLTYRTKMTHGFIDVKPNSNLTLAGIDAYTNKLVAWSNANIPAYITDDSGNPISDSEGNFMEIGWYTSVVAGPEVLMSSSKIGTYYGSPAIAYAALNARIDPQSAPTNKAISNASGIKFTFSNKQMNDLVNARFVIFKTKGAGTSNESDIPYVVDGCTASSTACDYNRISTVKVVTDVVDQIREVCDPFIGEPNTVEQRNAMSALISKRLTYLKEDGEISYFEFEVISTIEQMLLGECQISLTLVPPMELRKITTVVALRAAV